MKQQSKKISIFFSNNSNNTNNQNESNNQNSQQIINNQITTDSNSQIQQSNSNQQTYEIPSLINAPTKNTIKIKLTRPSLKSNNLSHENDTHKDIFISDSSLTHFTFGQNSIPGAGRNSILSSNSQNNFIKNIYKIEYNIAVKKIGKKLKQRTFLPKNFKIIDVLKPYSILVRRIAIEIKKTMGEMEQFRKKYLGWNEEDMKQIGEIALKSCKYLEKNNSNSRINMNLVNNLKINNNNTEENKNSQIYLIKNLDCSDNNKNFVAQFESFLKVNNINIDKVSKLPILLNINQKYILENKEFWMKLIKYISLNKNISIYTYTFIIEQFFLWCICENNDRSDFISEIKNQINKKFDKDTINTFLLSHKFDNLDDLFEKYKKIYDNNCKEAKINNCPICNDEDACTKRIIEINKKTNKICDSNNLSFIVEKKEIDNNDDIFSHNIDIQQRKSFHGISKRSKRKKFSPEKTQYDSNEDLRYQINGNNKNKKYSKKSKPKSKSYNRYKKK